MGHVLRCLALAQAWLDVGGRAELHSHRLGDRLRRRIESAGIAVRAVDEAYPAPAHPRFTLSRLDDLATRGDRPWLVLDGYGFDPAYQERVRAAGYRLLVMDDQAHQPRYHADILLNQNVHAERLAYQTDPDTLLLLGSRYALLRAEFWPYRGRPREIPSVARKILVTLGGGDAGRLGVEVIEALQGVDVDGLEAAVTVGPAWERPEVLDEAVRRSRIPIRLVRDAQDMPGLMAWADLAVAAAGSTCWELAFMGLPSLLFVRADNQRALAEGMARAGAAVDLGDWRGGGTKLLSARLAELCRDRDGRRRLSEAATRLVDGNGGARVAALMRDGFNRASVLELVRVRPAAMADAIGLWRLANEPSVRAKSFDPRPFSLEHHLRWFEDRLHSAGCRMWVVEVHGTMAAQVRYDRVDGDVAEVSFAVVPAFRGKGLGTAALAGTWRRACEELRARAVRGLVIVGNDASARAFLKAGFRQAGQVEVRGRRCDVFERACS